MKKNMEREMKTGLRVLRDVGFSLIRFTCRRGFRGLRLGFRV